MSQEAFGKRIGLSKSGISNIENGTRTISDTHIKIICSTFGISEEWLRTGKDIAKEVRELENFIDYLKSLDFSVEVECSTNPKDEDEYEIEITVQNQICKSVFSDKEFTHLQEQNKELIMGMILLQNQRNKKESPSAATENDSE